MLSYAVLYFAMLYAVLCYATSFDVMLSVT